MAVTIKDPVNITGFSTSTVSRVLSGRGYADEKNRSIITQAVRDTVWEYHPVPTRRGGINMVMLLPERDSVAEVQENAAANGAVP